MVEPFRGALRGSMVVEEEVLDCAGVGFEEA